MVCIKTGSSSCIASMFVGKELLIHPKHQDQRKKEKGKSFGCCNGRTKDFFWQWWNIFVLFLMTDGWIIYYSLFFVFTVKGKFKLLIRILLSKLLSLVSVSQKTNAMKMIVAQKKVIKRTCESVIIVEAWSVFVSTFNKNLSNRIDIINAWPRMDFFEAKRRWAIIKLNNYSDFLKLWSDEKSFLIWEKSVDAQFLTPEHWKPVGK